MVTPAYLSDVVKDYSNSTMAYASVLVLGAITFLYYITRPTFKFPENAPKLTKGAADYIVNVYATLRNEQAEDNQKRVSYPYKTSRLDCL